VADDFIKSPGVTLDPVSEPDIEAAWSAEIERRLIETLEAAASHLTPADRAGLVDRLIGTLDSNPEVEEAWAAEVERRQSAI
jgi:hypothetical protein